MKREARTKRCRGVALVVVALIAVSLPIAPAASAKATVIPGQGDFTPLRADPGTWTLSGGNWHVRWMVELYQQDMPGFDPRCNGLNTVIKDANWDANRIWPSWGTFCTVLMDRIPGRRP